jgi:hypothetical protein
VLHPELGAAILARNLLGVLPGALEPAAAAARVGGDGLVVLLRDELAPARGDDCGDAVADLRPDGLRECSADEARRPVD